MSIYSCYKLIHPPTTIDNAIACNFTGENDDNLIVSKTNFLDVYKRKNEEFAMVGSFQLFGGIESIASARFAGNKRDSLLISFTKEKKISVMDFDLSTNDLKTVSIHYFEDDFLKEGVFQYVNRTPIVVEPHNRCAAIIIYDTKLVVLPFKQEQSILDIDDQPTSIFTIDNSITINENAANSSDERAKSEAQVQEIDLPVKRQVIIDLAELGIRNVKDYCFLHGYYEPTILILHEPEPTWAGRLAAKKLTCAVTAISLDLQRAHYPVIYASASLPYDCYKVIPLLESVGGGVLVVSYTSLLHINQRVNYSISLNDFAPLTPDISIIVDTAPLNIVMDASAHVFLASNRILFSLKAGELYIVHLYTSGRAVRKMKISKLSSSVPASSMCIPSDGFLFIGSRLGDSLLVKYSEKDEDLKRKQSETDINEEPKNKKKRKLENGGSVNQMELESEEDFLNILEEDDDETFEFYEMSTDDSQYSLERMISYDLSLKDKFLNIGPVSALNIGQVMNYVDKRNKENNYEIVTCSGYGKNGSICLLQKNLRPELISSDKLKFVCYQMWSAKSESSKSADQNELLDSYLVFSLKNSTKIFKAGEGLDEITTQQGLGFITDKPTYNIGNVVQYTRIVQICTNSVRLLEGVNNKHEIQLEKDIHASFILDPYILLHFRDGGISLLVAQEERLQLKKPIFKKLLGKITAATLFCDNNNSPMFAIHAKKRSPYFCLVYWSSGVFEIFSIPDFTSVLIFTQFHSLVNTVFDQNPSTEDIAEFTSTSAQNVKYPYVIEMMLRNVGSKQEDPYLLVTLSDNTFHVYRSFCFEDPKANGALAPTFGAAKANRLSKLRFCKFQHDLVPLQLNTKSQKLDLESSNFFPIISSDNPQPRSHFVPFDNIRGMSGIFICGDNPAWIFTEREQLRVHPMTIEAPVLAFSPFHNEACQHGFVYYAAKTSIFKICQLDEDPLVSYKSHWCTRRIPLRATPHCAAYHLQTKTHVVGVSNTVKVKEMMLNNKEEEVELLPQNGRYPALTEEKYEVRLYSSNWQNIDSFKMDPHENILCVEVVMLPKENQNNEDEQYNRNQKKELTPFVAVGTGYVEGEDEACRGRIILFDFEARLTEQDQNTLKLEKLTAKELKGPVSSMSQLEDYLIVSEGPKLYVFYFDWGSKQLVPASFFDAQFYISSLKTIKNYVYYGDIHKSSHLLRWKDQGHRLYELAKDYNFLSVACTEFLVNKGNLGLVTADRESNFQILCFNPTSSESFGGKKLLPVADFHTGINISCMRRMKMRKRKSSVSVEETTKKNDHRKSSLTENDHQFVLFGAQDGSIGYIAPLGEVTHRRLSTLQMKMFTQIPHRAGLHPKAFRLFFSRLNLYRNNKKGVIDGELLWRFLNLDVITQRDLARQIGSNVEKILENLSELYEQTFYF